MSIHIPLYLKPEQRQALENLLRSGNPPARTLTRARILLLSDRSLGETHTDQYIAKTLLCSSQTVASIRKRFLDEGLDAALYDKPRPGPAPKFTGAMEARLTVLACSDAPEGQARWTVSLLADKVVEVGIIDQISRSTIGERLKKMKSNPGKSSPGSSENLPPRM
jgi:transposase